MAKEIKYYKVTVEMKHGFKYSYTCMGRMLESMKKSSEGYWTKSVTSEEITESDHIAFWAVGLVDEKPEKSVKKKLPKFSSLENFFQTEDSLYEGTDNDTGRPSVQTKKTSRNKTTNSKPKVRSRKSA